MTTPPERTIFCPKCKRPCSIRRQLDDAGATGSAEYYCPHHGTVTTEFPPKPDDTKRAAR